MLRKATTEEKQAYSGLYPLSHIATLDGVTLNVEGLGGHWSKGDPQYEVMAPDGFHFKYDYTHSLLCDNLADVRGRLKGAELEPCGDEC